MSVIATVLLPIMLISCATGPTVLDTQKVVEMRGSQKVVELPKGLKLKAALDKQLSSEQSRVGEQFTIHTVEPIYLGETILIPEGTRLYGEIKEIKPQTKFTKAKLILAFTKMDLRGRSYTIDGTMHKSMSDLAKKGGKEGGKTAAKEAAAAAIPILGPIFAVMKAKKAYDYVQSDKNIMLPVGTGVTIKLVQPVDIPHN
jgi:hypothetical protein